MSSVMLFLLSPLTKYLTASVVIAVVCGGLYLWFPFWLPARVRNALGIAALIAAFGGTFYWWAFRAGETHMAQRIAAKDAAAIARVGESLKDVEACNGGVDWNVVTGQCDSGR